MPLVGYSNTDGGVLVAMTKLNKLKLSKDKSRVSIGPGNRWIDVYRFLEPHGLVVAGGRDGSVGTGLLLGGGISFFGGQYGFSSDGVVGYQVRKSETPTWSIAFLILETRLLWPTGV